MTASTYIARSTKAIVLGLIVGALGAAAAQASQGNVPDAVDRYLANQQTHAVAPDDRAGIRCGGSEPVSPDLIERYLASHHGGGSQPDLIERYLASHRTQAVAPDDRAGIRSQPVSPDLIERYLATHPTRGASRAQSAGDGFDWSDAGIAAASSSFVTLLGGSALLILVRRRQHV